MWSLLSRTLPRRAAGWLLAGAALAACAVASCAGSIDLAVYLRAASELADGGDPNLTPDGQLPWLYPPFAAAVYLPLVVAPFPVSAILVALGSVAALFRTLRIHHCGDPRLYLPIPVQPARIGRRDQSVAHISLDPVTIAAVLLGIVLDAGEHEIAARPAPEDARPRPARLHRLGSPGGSPH